MRPMPARASDWLRRRPVIQQSRSCSLDCSGQDFAHGAAKVGIALPQFRAVRLGLLFHGQIGNDGFNFPAEEILQALVQFQRFGKEQAGVQCKDREIQARLLGQVHHDQAGALKTGADGRARAEAVPGPGQDVLGLHARQIARSRAATSRAVSVPEFAAAGAGACIRRRRLVTWAVGLRTAASSGSKTRWQKSPKRSRRVVRGRSG